MNLTQRQLHMFVTTAALCNISRASEALFISQPALTRALQEFESQLGAQLFVRSTRKMALTLEGERFLPVAQRLLNDLVEAAALVKEEASGHRGSVVVAVGEAFGCTVMPAILADFVKTHPGVRVRVLADNSLGITRAAVQGAVDFSIGSPVGQTDTLSFVRLLSAPLGVLAHPQMHRLKATLTADELDALPLLKEGPDTSIAHVLSARGSEVVAQMAKGVEVTSLAMQLSLARAGVGVAVMSALGASHREAADMRFSLLKPRVEREVFVMQRRDRPLPSAARALKDAICQGLANVPLHPSIRRFGPMA